MSAEGQRQHMSYKLPHGGCYWCIVCPVDHTVLSVSLSDHIQAILKAADIIKKIPL